MSVLSHGNLGIKVTMLPAAPQGGQQAARSWWTCRQRHSAKTARGLLRARVGIDGRALTHSIVTRQQPVLVAGWAHRQEGVTSVEAMSVAIALFQL